MAIREFTVGRNARRGAISVPLWIGAALSLLAPAVAKAQLTPWPENRVTNPGAEAGTAPSGWSTTTFATALYGSSAQVPPAGFGAGRDYNADYGSRTFVASAPGASMSQEVDLAGPIDAGARALRFGGSLGGGAGTADGATVTVQFLNSGGGSLGAPHVVGPPTADDRDGMTTQLECSAYASPPVGARAARVTVEAVGSGVASTATADAIFLTSADFGAPGTAVPAVPAQGPGCVLNRNDGSPMGNPPAMSGEPPVLSAVRLRRGRVSFHASAPGKVRVVIARRVSTKTHPRVRWVRKRAFSLRIGKRGTARRSFKRPLHGGAYRVRLSAKGTGGKAGGLVTVRRRISPR